MAIKAKIKNPPDKKEPPKREPIVVSDINDSRLKAYRDSLDLYKRFPLPPIGYKISPYVFQKTAGFVVGKDSRGNNIIEKRPNTRPKIEPIGFTKHNAGKGGTSYNLNETKYENYFDPERPVYKKPVQPVIFKAKEKIGPTAKKITFEKSEVTPKKEPSKIKDKELTYRVEYYDPEKKQMTHQMFASEREGSLFQKGLSSANQLYGTKGYYVKSPSK